jgi:lipopolysaccharide export system protein LptA
MRRSVVTMTMVLALGCALAVTSTHSGQGKPSKRDLASKEHAASRQNIATNGSLASVPGAVRGADLPVEITTSKVVVKYAGNVRMAVCEGPVKVEQGDVTLTCDKLVIESDAKGAKQGRENRGSAKQLPVDLQNGSDMKSITASGNVKVLQGDRMALAGKAVFDNVKRIITLSENPKLWQGPDILTGDKVIIFLDEGRFEVLTSDGKKKPITITINPGKHKKEQGE